MDFVEYRWNALVRKIGSAACVTTEGDSKDLPVGHVGERGLSRL